VLLALQSLSSSPEAFDKAMCALEDATGRKRNAPVRLFSACFLIFFSLFISSVVGLSLNSRRHCHFNLLH
jgi:hypothetical protein